MEVIYPCTAIRSRIGWILFRVDIDCVCENGMNDWYRSSISFYVGEDDRVGASLFIVVYELSTGFLFQALQDVGRISAEDLAVWEEWKDHRVGNRSTSSISPWIDGSTRLKRVRQIWSKNVHDVWIGIRLRGRPYMIYSMYCRSEYAVVEEIV